MKELKVKNLKLDISDDMPEDVASELKRKIELMIDSISISNKYVHLVKINVGEMRAEQVSHLLNQLKGRFYRKKLKNCIFIPICDSGIKNITIETINIDTEENIKQ